MENAILSFMSYIKGTMHCGSRPSDKRRGGGGAALAVSQTMRQEGPITIFFWFKINGALQEKTQIRPRVLVLVNIIITCLPPGIQSDNVFTPSVLKRVQRWRVS